MTEKMNAVVNVAAHAMNANAVNTNANPPENVVNVVMVERVPCTAAGCGRVFQRGGALKAHVSMQNSPKKLAENGGNHIGCPNADGESVWVEGKIPCACGCNTSYIDRDEFKLHRNKQNKDRNKEAKAALAAAAEAAAKAVANLHSAPIAQPVASTAQPILVAQPTPVAQPAPSVQPAPQVFAPSRFQVVMKTHPPHVTAPSRQESSLQARIEEIRHDEKLMQQEVERMKADAEKNAKKDAEKNKRSHEPSQPSSAQPSILLPPLGGQMGQIVNKMATTVTALAESDDDDQPSVEPAMPPLKKNRIMSSKNDAGKPIYDDDIIDSEDETIDNLIAKQNLPKKPGQPHAAQHAQPPSAQKTHKPQAEKNANKPSAEKQKTAGTTWESLCRIGSSLPDSLLISDAISKLPSTHAVPLSTHLPSIKKLEYYSVTTVGDVRQLAPALFVQKFSPEFFGDNLVFVNCLYAFRGGN